MKMALLGVDNTERCDKVGDDHEGEEDEDEEVQVGSQQGEDEPPEILMCQCTMQWGDNIRNFSPLSENMTILRENVTFTF